MSGHARPNPTELRAFVVIRRIVSGIGDLVAAVVGRLDALQRGWAPAGFVIGVVKKYGDDRAGQFAALISYYTFFSLFPLLMAFSQILALVLEGNPSLREDLTSSALANIPVIGDQIKSSVGTVRGSGAALVIGIGVALWAGLGATQAAQDAMNTVFDVAVLERPNFWLRKLRGLLTLVVLGVSVVAATALGSISSATAWLGFAGRITGVAGQLVVNGLLVGALFRVLAKRPDPSEARRLWPGMAFGAVGWTVLQYVGGVYVGSVVSRASRTYGVFAVVIGLLSWIYLQAQILLYAAEVTTVAGQRIWPRALVRENPTDADHRAAHAVIERERRLLQGAQRDAGADDGAAPVDGGAGSGDR